jgi:hypothetical protein
LRLTFNGHQNVLGMVQAQVGRQAPQRRVRTNGRRERNRRTRLENAEHSVVNASSIAVRFEVEDSNGSAPMLDDDDEEC